MITQRSRQCYAVVFLLNCASLFAKSVVINGESGLWQFTSNYSVHGQGSFGWTTSMSSIAGTNVTLVSSGNQGSSNVYLYDFESAPTSIAPQYSYGFNEGYDFEGIHYQGDGVIAMSSQYLAVSIPLNGYPYIYGQIVFYEYDQLARNWIYLNTYTPTYETWLGQALSFNNDMLAATTCCGGQPNLIWFFTYDKIANEFVFTSSFTAPEAPYGVSLYNTTVAIAGAYGNVYLYSYNTSNHLFDSFWTLTQTLVVGGSNGDSVTSINLYDTSLVVACSSLPHFSVYKYDKSTKVWSLNYNVNKTSISDDIKDFGNMFLLSADLLVVSVDLTTNEGAVLTFDISSSTTSDSSWLLQNNMTASPGHGSNNFGYRIGGIWPYLTISSEADVFLLTYTGSTGDDSSSSSSSSSSTSSLALSTGALAGVIVGGIVFMGLIVFTVVYLLCFTSLGLSQYDSNNQAAASTTSSFSRPSEIEVKSSTVQNPIATATSSKV